jgi:hypothetical protein
VYGASSGGGTGVYAYSSSSNAIFATSGSSSSNDVIVANYVSNGSSNGIKGTSSSTNTGSAAVYGYNSGSGYGVKGQCAASYCYGGYFLGGLYSSTYLKIGSTCEFGTCSSDQRLKQNIRPLTGALDQIVQLKPVTYEWRTPDAEHPKGIQTGFIAQDVEKVFPRWVAEGADGFKTLDLEYRTVVAMVVEAIRELNDRAGKAEARADKAEAKNKDLEERVERLEHGRMPRIALNPETMFVGFGFFALAGVLAYNSNKRREESDKQG